MLAACQRPGPGPGEARLVLGDGDEVAGSLHDGSIVRRGQVVRALRGEPQLELSRRSRQHRRLTLRPGTQLRVDDPIEVVRGDVLSEGATAFDAGVAEVEADGIVRVTRTLASSVRVYDGEAEVTSAGRSLTVPARQDATVPALGLVPVAAKWVTWDAEEPDAWDRLHLGIAIDLTREFESGGRSFAYAVRGEPGVDVAGLITGLPANAWVDALSRYSPNEAVVGGVIATVARDPLSRVFALRTSGAPWGIVAIERAGGDSARAVELLWDSLGRWSQRTGVSGVGGRRGVAFDAGVAAGGGPATAVLGGSTGSGSGGQSATPSSPQAPGTTTTTLPVTLPPVTVTVPPATVPPPTVPTVPAVPVPQVTVPLVPELP